MMKITLENDCLQLAFRTLGGEMTSLRSQEGIEYLWQGDDRYWAGQAPVLFPICGSVRNGQVYYDMNGEELVGRLPRHGLIRKKEFVLTEQVENRVTFEIQADKESYAQYPYRFKVAISYQLQESTVLISYAVTNCEKERIMPYFIGGHPAFNCPLDTSEVFSDYQLIFEKEEMCSIPRLFADTGLVDRRERQDFLENQQILPLDHTLFDEDAIILDQLTSNSVSYVSKKSGHGVEFNFEDFPNLVLWSSANQGPFLALEPWTGISTSAEEGDRLEEKQGVILLEPLQQMVHQYKIRVF